MFLSFHVMIRITNLLIPVIFMLALTFAAIASDNNNTSPDVATSTNASVNAAGFCYGRGFEDQKRTSYAHCQRAVRLMPDDNVPGLFHMNGANDTFRLPRIVHYESCMVVVHLASDDELPDQCTWHMIWGEAGRLTARCRSPGITDLTTGGFNFVGDRGTIMISVEKYPEDPLSIEYAATGLRFPEVGLERRG